MGSFIVASSLGTVLAMLGFLIFEVKILVQMLRGHPLLKTVCFCIFMTEKIADNHFLASAVIAVKDI